MLRYPPIVLLSVSLSLGSNYFQRQHLADVNQVLARISPPKVASQSPLKPLPVRQPVHDPATCPVCLALHATLTAQIVSAPILAPIDRVGVVRVEPASSFDPIHFSAEQCRGPPAI